MMKNILWLMAFAVLLSACGTGMSSYTEPEVNYKWNPDYIDYYTIDEGFVVLNERPVSFITAISINGWEWEDLYIGYNETWEVEFELENISYNVVVEYENGFKAIVRFDVLGDRTYLIIIKE